MLNKPQRNDERFKSVIRKCAQGFTLLELMIVVAIIGILATIAVPSYLEYVQRGRIAEAVGGLAPMQSKMDQFFLDNRTYLGACAAGTLAQLPANTNYFDYTCPALAANAYTVTATGKSSMVGFAYSLSLNGGAVTKSTDAVPTGWTANATCWVFKKDGSC